MYFQKHMEISFNAISLNLYFSNHTGCHSLVNQNKIEVCFVLTSRLILKSSFETHWKAPMARVKFSQYEGLSFQTWRDLSEIPSFQVSGSGIAIIANCAEHRWERHFLWVFNTALYSVSVPIAYIIFRMTWLKTHFEITCRHKA